MRVESVLRRAVALALVLLAGGALLAQEKDKDADKEKDRDTRAVLIVKVPEDAKLTIEGTPTRQTGETRKFVSPALKPGKEYEYTLVARWEPNNYTTITRTRKVTVLPGKEARVDMTTKDPKQPDDIVIRYVPTPPEVVEAMLRLAKVGKDDVVYDLGCGDGRIVCTAVSKFGAKRGVGVDLDPERIKDSKETAKASGVEGKVEFRQGDVMKVKDIGNASVVTLYLADPLNEQLRPILQKNLKPGSRIVSHRFLMGDWKPEKTEKIDVAGEDYLIHLWTIKGKAPEKDKDADKGKDKDTDKDKDLDKGR